MKSMAGNMRPIIGFGEADLPDERVVDDIGWQHIHHVRQIDQAVFERDGETVVYFVFESFPPGR